MNIISGFLLFSLLAQFISSSNNPLRINSVITSQAEYSILSPGGTSIIYFPHDISDFQVAINQVADGGIIEMAQGTYYSPSGGWRINDTTKRFTIRAAQNAQVILDGQGKNDIVRYQNTSLSKAGSVYFLGITFANGETSTEGLAGGITIYSGRATFENCTFTGNTAQVSTTVGGAVYIAEQSSVFFLVDLFQNNSSTNGGGGIGIRSNSNVYIHQSKFIANNTTMAGQIAGASGGAINAGNSLLRISDSRFENNQAGGHGGALYAIGNWAAPDNIPQMDVIVVNSTFISNQARRAANQNYPSEGGAINTEDQTTIKIYNSRFLLNSADIGGGINSYRSFNEIYDSVFQGNVATDTRAYSGFGGAVELSSADGPTDGMNNRRTAHLIMEDTFVQGDYGPVTNEAQTGGCLFAGGDATRIDGDPTVPDMGTIADNQAQVTLNRVVLNDCHALFIGGAMLFSLTNLYAQNVLVQNSKVTGANASGGGLSLLYDSTANLDKMFFANNSSTLFGGAVFVQGSTINMSNSTLLNNSLPGTPSDWFTSYGAAIFTSVDDARKINSAGLISNNQFIGNSGMAIFDDDRNISNGPYNAVVYNSNRFYSTFYPQNEIYRDSLSNKMTASGLNLLVIDRSAGRLPSTDKSTVDNNDLTSSPVTGVILAVPSKLVTTKAAGDEDLNYYSFLGYAWNGSPAYFNGNLLNGSTSVTPTNLPMSYELNVNGNAYALLLSVATSPSATFAITPSGPSFVLNWSVICDGFLDSNIDQDIPASTKTTNIVIITAPENLTFHFYALAQEGGEVVSRVTGVNTHPFPYKSYIPLVKN